MPYLLPDGRLLLGANLHRSLLPVRSMPRVADPAPDVEALARTSPIGNRVARVRDAIAAGTSSAVGLLLIGRVEDMARLGAPDASALAMATLEAMVASEHLCWTVADDDLVPGPRWHPVADRRDLDIGQSGVSLRIGMFAVVGDPLVCWEDGHSSTHTGALAIRLVEALAERPSVRLDRVASVLRRELRVLAHDARPDRAWIRTQLRRLALLLRDLGWVEEVGHHGGLPTLSVTPLGLVGAMMMVVELSGDLSDAVAEVLGADVGLTMGATPP